MTAAATNRLGRRLKSVLDATVAGAIVTVLGFFDDMTIGPIVIGLAAVLPALITLAATAVVYSLVLYAVASMILATVDVVAIWNLSSAETMPRPRVVLSAVVYGTWCAVLWTAAGYGIGVGIKSL